MGATSAIDGSAQRVADELARRRLRLVLAESCTGGLVSATLARIPGISECLCGSAVVYRNATKQAWLDVPPGILEDPHVGPVSMTCAQAMARGALARTPEALIALAITGHLGPDAPAELDGVVHIAIARRSAGNAEDVVHHRVLLPRDHSDPPSLRLMRQSAAAGAALDLLYEQLQASAPL